VHSFQRPARNLGVTLRLMERQSGYHCTAVHWHVLRGLHSESHQPYTYIQAAAGKRTPTYLQSSQRQCKAVSLSFGFNNHNRPPAPGGVMLRANVPRWSGMPGCGASTCTVAVTWSRVHTL
jgi:hypothetical protein